MVYEPSDDHVSFIGRRNSRFTRRHCPIALRLIPGRVKLEESTHFFFHTRLKVSAAALVLDFRRKPTATKVLIGSFELTNTSSSVTHMDGLAR